MNTQARANFKTPPAALGTIPLWHMNGRLTREEIAAQLKASRNISGFAGVAVLPLRHTKPPYLTEAYFERYGDILDISRELGMRVVFYDDSGFPSGTAGGRMKARFPEHIASRLDKAESTVRGPKTWTATLPDGTFMGAVAMNVKTLERRDITDHARDGMLKWSVPDGEWKIMIFTCVRCGEFVDYLDPDSVGKFCSLTYDAFYRRFPDHFGSTITMSFFDDINMREEGHRIWTPGFNEKFKAKHGFSPVAYYPALWYDIGPDTAPARVALFDFRAELLAEGFPRTVNEWCGKHGIGSTGHAMGQYHPQPTFLGGDHIKFYRHCDIPMIDSIHYHGHGRPGYKLTSSAAYSYDRPLTAVEIYGAYRRPFDKDMLYRSGMELFARGGNLLLPHGMWYDPEHVWIPPLISHFSKEVGPALAQYNNWAARSSLLLQGGRHVADIGVLYPVATMQAYVHFGIEEDLHPGLTMPKNSDFNALSDLLTGAIRRDFTVLHPEIIDGKCRVSGARFHLDNTTNFEEYGIIIIPSLSTIHWSNLQKIKSFYESGGKVIATTQCPTVSAEFGRNREVEETVKAMFHTASVGDEGYARQSNEAGGVSYFVPLLGDHGAALAAALKDAAPVPDVRFGPGAPVFTHLPQSGSCPPENGTHTGMLSYIHKIKNGRHIYFFANSTDDSVDLDVVLRGERALQSWSPDDGSISSTESEWGKENGTVCTRARLKLGPVQSVFLVGAEPDTGAMRCS